MSPQNIEYEGRHRDKSAKAWDRSADRDYNARWFGYEYKPRHSADFREVSA